MLSCNVNVRFDHSSWCQHTRTLDFEPHKIPSWHHKPLKQLSNTLDCEDWGYITFGLVCVTKRQLSGVSIHTGSWELQIMQIMCTYCRMKSSVTASIKQQWMRPVFTQVDWSENYCCVLGQYCQLYFFFRNSQKVHMRSMVLILINQRDEMIILIYNIQGRL